MLKAVRFGMLLAWTAAGTALAASFAAEPSMPATEGETLTGQHIVLANAVRGHATIIVAGFSHEGGNQTGAWVKAIHADQAMAGVPVYTVAMLAGAPGFVRGMIKNSMKKGVPPADQANFVVLVQDEKPWRQYFGVTEDKEAYIILLDAQENVIWHGHGAAADLEPQLRVALK